jgi:DNA-binding transcriptional ArsR family regulator
MARHALIPSDAFVVATAVQRAALGSPIRLEALELFATHGPVSVAEVARFMGRSPESLHYHVRQMAKAGVLVPAGSRKSGKRDETLYKTVAEKIAMPCNPASRPSRAAALATIGSLLRLTEREAAAAMNHAGDLQQHGPRRNFHLRRIPAHLSKNALAKINSHIDAIEALCAKERARRPRPEDADAVCSVTMALMPMNRDSGDT